MTEQTGDITWHNARECGVNGRGWDDTRTPYERLPARAAGVVREIVWTLSLAPTGLTVRFATDAETIRLRWQMAAPIEHPYKFAPVMRSGFDLYGYDRVTGRWRWVDIPDEQNDRSGETQLCAGLDGQLRLYELYLPLFTPLEAFDIGIPSSAAFGAIPRRPEQPIVYYGTSIVNGAGASRPGMCLTSILSRRVNLPVINLGFSGNAHMEPELAPFLAELDPCVFVVDALPNMGRELVEENAEHFLRTLRAARPETPILVLEDRTWTNAWIRPAMREMHEEKRKALRGIIETLRRDGMRGLTTIDGEMLFGTDDEGTVDGSHPTDLGAYRMIDVIEPVVRTILGRF
ncbi:MAG: SGNH/GDSL hydrolase family protein [Candidatus Pacebacteria bacterium]|nr:SGNH/GDSL hydrolase family protein [Candidatus Paceibacterota bacterium]